MSTSAKSGTSTTFRDKVADYFKARPLVWIDGVTLEPIGGKYAWRSRVSDCRTELGMDIRNRQQRMKTADGKTWTVSWYCYFPAVEIPADPAPSEVRGWNANDRRDGMLI